MQRLIRIACLVFVFCGVAKADFSNVGSAGAQYLKIGVGSRYQAMGEASVAVANDVYSMYWNPAGLVEIECKTLRTEIVYLFTQILGRETKSKHIGQLAGK